MNLKFSLFKKKKKIARKKPKFKEFYIETIKCNLEISCSFKNLKQTQKKCFPSSHMHSRK